MISKPSCLCNIPWRVLDVNLDGTVQVCCKATGKVVDLTGAPYNINDHSVNQIFTSDYMKLMRAKFRNNEKPEQCAACWRDEELKHRSYRQLLANADDMLPNMYWLEEPLYISTIQLATSNVCNLKCLMCSPKFSSRWQKEAAALSTNVELSNVANTSISKLLDEIEIWSQQLKRVWLSGGEPLLITQYKTLLDALILRNAKDISVGLNTNGTIWNEQQIMQIVHNFKQTYVWVSIDGVGAVFEYQRFPASWPKTLENLHKYKALSQTYSTVTFGITCAIGWVNILGLQQLYQLFATTFPNITANNTLINLPEHMALWAVPKHFKEYVANAINNWQYTQWADINGLVNFMYSREITNEQFLENLRIFRKHDKYRGNDLLTAVPDWAPLLKPYWDQILTEDFSL